jgi:hypothetical protein
MENWQNLALAAALVAFVYLLVAPDVRTASLRSAAGSAIGSGARAGSGSVGSDFKAWQSGRTGRANQKATDRRSGMGSRSSRVDAWLAKDGPVASWFQSVGQSIAGAARSTRSAARSGWQSGRRSGQVGLPSPVRRGVARLRGKTGAAPAARRDTPGLDQPTGKIASGRKRTVAVINSEAGLLPIAEQIVAVVSEIGALADAIESAQSMTDLGFDPGAELQQSISSLLEGLVDPQKLRALADLAPAFKAAVERHITQVAGV